MVSQRLEPFGSTIFTEISALSRQHGATALGQGYPTFEGPESVKQAAIDNGWHRTQLYRWLRRAGIDASRFR